MAAIILTKGHKMLSCPWAVAVTTWGTALKVNKRKPLADAIKYQRKDNVTDNGESTPGEIWKPPPPQEVPCSLGWAGLK